MNDDDIFALPTPPPPGNDNIFALPGDPVSPDISKDTEASPVSADIGHAKRIAEMEDSIKRQLDWHFGQLKDIASDAKPVPQVEAGEPELPPTPEPEPEPVQLPAPLKPLGGVPYPPDPATFTPTDDAVFTPVAPDVKSPLPISADIRTATYTPHVSADTPATFSPTDDATFAPVVPDVFAAEPAKPPPLPGPQPQIVSAPPMPVNRPPREVMKSPPAIFQDIRRSMDSLGLSMPSPSVAQVEMPGSQVEIPDAVAPLPRANAGGVHIEPSKPGGRLSIAGHMALGLHDALGVHRAYGISAPVGLRELSTAAKVASSWMGDKHTFGDRLRERMRMPTAVKSSTASSAPNSPATSSAAPMTATSVSPGMPESPAASFMPDWLPSGLPASALGSFDVGGMTGGSANPFSAGASPRTASGVGGSTFAGGSVGSMPGEGGDVVRLLTAILETLKRIEGKADGDETETARNAPDSPGWQDMDVDAPKNPDRQPFAIQSGPSGPARPQPPASNSGGGFWSTLTGGLM